MKVCLKCKQEKPLTEFRQVKSGRHKGWHQSYCKACEKKISRDPWQKTYKRIYNRCKYSDSYHARYRNMEMTITPMQLKSLWFRDKADLMEQPSIDRIDSSLGYHLDNCRYLELEENLARQRLVLKK